MEDKKALKIGVLSGGFSREREVSLRSGRNVCQALSKKGYTVLNLDPVYDDLLSHQVDIVFNVLHGAYGEDGGIQSFLDLHNIKYTGSGVRSSVIGMNKLLTKQLLFENNLSTPSFIIAASTSDVPTFNFPYILKPISEGSSVGVYVVETEKDYLHYLKLLLEQYGTCLVEEYISGQEVTVGILDKGSESIALPILELQPKNKFYDYEAKYTAGMTEFILPARLSDSVTQDCKKLALDIYKMVGCKSFARVDMMVHPEKGPFVLEINTVPGMTSLSDLPAQAAEYGLCFEDLVETILLSSL